MRPIKCCRSHNRNVALQLGLLAVLEEAGVQPAAVVSHSVGEIAGILRAALSLSDTACVAYRSRLQQTLAGTGRMLAVGLVTLVPHDCAVCREGLYRGSQQPGVHYARWRGISIASLGRTVDDASLQSRPTGRNSTIAR